MYLLIAAVNNISNVVWYLLYSNIHQNIKVKLPFHMYVPPIHVDLVHFQGTWGARVPYLHVDQNMSTWHLHVFSQHCHVVLSAYKLYTKFHKA